MLFAQPQIRRCMYRRLEPKLIGVCYYYDNVARGGLCFYTDKWAVLEVKEVNEIVVL